MPSDDYTAAPSSGKLKLKGVTGSKIEKKKKKKSKDKERSKDKPELAVEKKARDGEDEGKRGSAEDEFEIREEDEDVDAVGITKTPAELRHEEMKRKRLDERLKREGAKTHKERVEDLNRYLSNLSEHHDMPRIGPG